MAPTTWFLVKEEVDEEEIELVRRWVPVTVSDCLIHFSAEHEVSQVLQRHFESRLYRRHQLPAAVERLKRKRREDREEKKRRLAQEIEELKKAKMGKIEVRRLRDEKANREALQREIDRLKAEDSDRSLDAAEPSFARDDWGVEIPGTLMEYSLNAMDELEPKCTRGIRIRISERPFGSGTFRNAFYCRVEGQPMVGKIFKDYVSDEESAYKVDVQQLLLAEKFALLFNAKNPSKKVHYVNAKILKLGTPWKGVNYIFLEQKLNGAWVKFNNNSKYVSRDEDKCRTAQAFSHFTFDASGERYMVTDVQGTQQDDNSLLLTDPAIHSVSRRYGGSDRGERGFIDFFHCHACNPICRHVGNVRNRHQKLAFDDSATVMRPRTAPTPYF